METKAENGTRERIARFLPDAIARAMESYQEFSLRGVAAEATDKAKDFSAHHSACKVAAAHIELLLKLAKWAELPSRNAGTHGDQIRLAASMREAEEELDEYKKAMEAEGFPEDE